MSVQKDTRVLKQLIRQTPEKADALLRAAAEQMVGDIKLSFGTSPSRPGEPPGVVSGELRASMRWERVAPLHLIIADGVIYGVYQELGTEHLAARPFVAPVFQLWRKKRFLEFAREFGVFDV